MPLRSNSSTPEGEACFAVCAAAESTINEKGKTQTNRMAIRIKHLKHSGITSTLSQMRPIGVQGAQSKSLPEECYGVAIGLKLSTFTLDPKRR